jgi:HK97 family phage prohead protease
METKTLSINDCDLKFAANEGEFSGYGSVFDVEDSEKDVILKGAFDEVLKSGQEVKLYVNHGWLRGELPVGAWTDLKQDERGLFGNAKIETRMPSGLNAYWGVKSGLVQGLSIGFKVNDYEKRSEGGRIIKSFSALKEISIVDSPANKHAQITHVKSIDDVKSEIESIKSIKDLESYLRESGNYSKSAAMALIAQCKSLFSGDQNVDELQKVQQKLTQLMNRI